MEAVTALGIFGGIAILAVIIVVAAVAAIVAGAFDTMNEDEM